MYIVLIVCSYLVVIRWRKNW